jgi:hypothetical protein
MASLVTSPFLAPKFPNIVWRRSSGVFTVEPPRWNTGMSLRRDSVVPSHALRRRIKPGASLT